MLNALKKLETLLTPKPAPPPKPSAHKPKRTHIPKEYHKPKKVHGFYYLDTFTEEDWIYFKYLQRYLLTFADVIKTTTPQALADEMEQSLMAMNTGRTLNNYQKLLISAYFICPVPTLETPEIATWLIDYTAKKLASSKSALNEIPQKHHASA